MCRKLSVLIILSMFSFVVCAKERESHYDFHKFLNSFFHGKYERPNSGAVITWNGSEWVPRKFQKYASNVVAEDVGEQYIWDGRKWIAHDGNDNDEGVEKIVAGMGLLADGEVNGVITSVGVLSIDVGNNPGQIPQFNQDGDLAIQGGIIFSDGSILESANGIGGAGSVGPMGPQGPQGIQGEVGPMGPQGEMGPMGPQGLQGLQGLAGIAGAVGPQGPMGEMGLMGLQGVQGMKGDKGDQGLPGIAGPVGPMGSQGPQGVAGVSGAMGPQGPQGEMGLMGLQGVQGMKGDQGLAGAPGAMGPMGPQGLQGVAGVDGSQGIQGEMGPQGLKGDKGDRGDQGLQGIAGAMGPMGLQGLQGPAGLDATVSLAAGVGIVGYPTEMIGSTGTINVDVGVGANQIPQLDMNGKLNPSVIPSNVGGNKVKVAFIKDVKPNNTAGGTCTAGSWITRDLNSLSGDSSFVSLAGNQFTLQPGFYVIESSAPAYVTSFHKTKLVDSNDVTIIVGSNGHSNQSAPSLTHSNIMGSINIAVATTYMVKHRCQITTPATGFGVQSNFGESEVYTQVKITKIE